MKYKIILMMTYKIYLNMMIITNNKLDVYMLIKNKNLYK